MKHFVFCLETLIVIIALQQLAIAQTNCLLPTDAEIKQNIVGHLQSQSGDAGTPFTVTLSEPVQYTCLAQGTVRNTYSFVSIVANFTSVPPRSITLVHYQRRCESGIWGAVGGDSFETSVPDNLQPPTRTDCFQCTNQLGDPHHCRSCSPSCPGLGRCTNLGVCCSFFTTNGVCTNNCTTSDGPNFIADISTNFTCICNLNCPPGEAPNSDCTICELRDICVRDMPCQNGGTCTLLSAPDNYTCTCAPDYTGENCTININNCDPNPCENGGSCINGLNDYTCICVPGYTGRNCSTNIDDCDPNPCQNGGSCIDGINGYTCNCAGSWTSENCTFCPIDGCKICSPVIGVCSVCFDGYLLNSNGICAKSFCNQACVGKTGYELNLCMFLCYLNEWYKHAVQCGLSIPPVMPTDSSLSLSEQWKQLHDQLQNYQTIWFNEATSRGLTISPLQQQTTFSDLNDLWLDISQNAFSLQTVWQNHTITLQPSIELEDFTNVNRDSNNATFKSFNHLWSKDLSTFNEETDMNCQLRGT